ncbi:HAMP domain-containing protein, partial [Bacteroides fragilis]|nr:HAMP domain-containing protein [Bacteroides fragilis]
GAMLLVIVALGVLLAIFAGMLVSKTGMQPISRLKRAADYVTQTNDLRPIEVVNNDEMAQLTVSFNQMLEALQQSRVQQAQFVADAGHELKTPLAQCCSLSLRLAFCWRSLPACSFPRLVCSRFRA